VFAHLFVLVERNVEPFGAGRISALAQELRGLCVEALRRLGDSLVHVTEERFGLRDANLLFVHSPGFSRRRRLGKERSRRDLGCGRYARPVIARAWPEEVERVAAFLREAGVESRIEEFSDGTPTAEDAARAVGCALGQIVKSLVFDCDGRSVLVLVPGDRRADKSKVAEAAGCARARIAGAEQVRKATGFELGAVAPFPLEGVEAVFLDRSLLQHPLVWIGAGSTRHMAALTPTELMRLTRAQALDIADTH